MREFRDDITVQYSTPNGYKRMNNKPSEHLRSHYAYQHKPRGAHQVNKSIEVNKDFRMLTTNRNTRREEVTDSHSKIVHAEPVRNLKVIRSVSNKNSMNNLLRGPGINAFSFPERERLDQLKPDKARYVNNHEEDLEQSSSESNLKETPFNKCRVSNDYRKQNKFREQ